MGIHFKKFNTHGEYQAFVSSGITYWPNISICEDNYDTHFNDNGTIVNPSGSPEPPTPTHDYVEIGGVKWATMNIGATAVTDSGLYFQWGDTQGYTTSQVGVDKYFNYDDYKYYGENYEPTKYNNTDGKTVLDLSDDAVNAAWGGNWRMPTTAEFAALGAAVNSAWTADYQGTGVAGMTFTDKTDSSKVLFFPAAGYCSDVSVYDVGSFGYYWSGSLCDGDVLNSYNLYFSSGYVDWQNYDGFRSIGFPVRGVLVENS